MLSIDFGECDNMIVGFKCFINPMASYCEKRVMCACCAPIEGERDATIEIQELLAKTTFNYERFRIDLVGNCLSRRNVAFFQVGPKEAK